MSRGELSFSLLVEELLHQIPKSERRQISVELLCIVATILSRNPELRFQQILDLDLLLEDAFSMYCRVRKLCLFILDQFYINLNYFFFKDHNLTITKDITPLFSLNYSSSVGYLARASVNSVLQKAALSSNPSEEQPHDNIEETCKVS